MLELNCQMAHDPLMIRHQFHPPKLQIDLQKKQKIPKKNYKEQMSINSVDKIFIRFIFLRWRSMKKGFSVLFVYNITLLIFPEDSPQEYPPKL